MLPRLAQIGLTGTPLGTKIEDVDKLLAVIKGDVNANANDEGFVSYFMERPPAVFAPLHMPGMLSKEGVLPGVLTLSGLMPGPSAIRSFELQNFESKDKGNLATYYKQMDGSTDDLTLAPRCSIGQLSFGHAGSAKVRWIRSQCSSLIRVPCTSTPNQVFRMLEGESGSLLEQKLENGEDALSSRSLG